jgi:hypothetical protein
MSRVDSNEIKARVRAAKVQVVAEATGVPYETLRRFVATDQSRIRNDAHWAAIERWAHPERAESPDYWRGVLDAAMAHSEVTTRLLASVSAAGVLGGGPRAAAASRVGSGPPPSRAPAPAGRRRKGSG